MPVDSGGWIPNVPAPFSNMSSTEPKPATQTLTPQQIPMTSPQLMSRYITDTGKILPRKYTHLSAKEQRSVTSKIKSARNLLTML
jgi:small subunit ribosomal protein S18